MPSYGVQIQFGTSTGSVSLYTTVSAKSESYKRNAEKATVKNAAGNTVGVAYTDASDTLSLDLNVAKQNGVIPATPIPGQAVTITVLPGGDESLNGLWLLDSAELSASNTDYASTKLELSRHVEVVVV